MDIVVYMQICALTALNCTMALKIKITHGRVCDVAIDNRSRSAIPLVRVISKYDCFQKTEDNKKSLGDTDPAGGAAGKKTA